MKLESVALEKELENIKAYCDEFGIDVYYDGMSLIYDYEETEEDEYKEETEEDILSEESEITIYVPKDSDGFTCVLKDLIRNIDEAKKGNFFNEYTFVSQKVAFIRIGITHLDFQSSALAEMNLHTSVEFTDAAYNVEIVWGLNSFNLKLVEEDKYNKYVPAYLEEDIFIKLECDKNIDTSLLNEIFDSYFFELKTSLDIEIRAEPWEYEIWDYDEEFSDDIESTILRPLLQGRGIKELLNIYKSAFHMSYPEQQVLTFSRVIEYVSQTVIRKDLIEKTITKLSSKRALSPDSTYILELGKIFDDHRDLGKDYQAFKITIETCCDIYELVEFAPAYLKKAKKITLESKTDSIQQAFGEIVDAVTATRNMFAHAKTNYKMKGTECPENHLVEFSRLLDIIAQQTIRWFAMQKEENRIV